MADRKRKKGRSDEPYKVEDLTGGMALARTNSGMFERWTVNKDKLSGEKLSLPVNERIIVSPTEPLELRNSGRSSWLPEDYGVDVLWHLGDAGDGQDAWGSDKLEAFLQLVKDKQAEGIQLPVPKMFGIQRKELTDLVNSMMDGRLQKELAQMKQLSRRMIVVEGKQQWTVDGELIHRFVKGFNKSQINSFALSTLFEFDTPVTYTDSVMDTIRTVWATVNYSLKPEHNSLYGRPKEQAPWGTAANVHNALYFMQGLPQVGDKTARAIWKHFGCVPMAWSVTAGELEQVPGIGKKTAEMLINFFGKKQQAGGSKS